MEVTSLNDSDGEIEVQIKLKRMKIQKKLEKSQATIAIYSVLQMRVDLYSGALQVCNPKCWKFCWKMNRKLQIVQ